MADGTTHIPRGGGSATHVAHCNNIHPYFGHWCDVLPLIGGRLFRMPRGEDAKRQSLLRFELFKKIDKFLSLNLRNILISPLEGEKKFLSELNELRNKGRLGILVQREAGFEPSPAFVMLPGVRKRLLPLTKREGCDSVISSDFKSKISITNENNLSCKDLSYFGRSALLCRQGRELSALVPQYLSNFSETVFSRFTSHFSRNRTAFTLAEVLITLGVIGIVAALTLSLIQSYKERVTVTKVQKAYSILNQAFKRISEEYGEPQNWPDVQNGAPNCNSCALAHKNLYSKYIIGKNHNGARGNTNDPIKTLNGGIFTWNRYNPSITTSDGIVYQFSHFRNCGGYLLTTGNLSACEMGGDVSIDINGYDKGPNQLGKDVFAFVTAQNGVYPAGLPGSYTAGDCKLSGRGFSCTEYILREKNMKYLKEN